MKLICLLLGSLATVTLAASLAAHPCERECSLDPAERMRCEFNFTVENFWTMSLACGDCPNTPGDCSNPGCVSADGNPRAVTVVNREIPGPTIRVCEGDTVIVNVKNSLSVETTTIHWHGIHMKKTPWMDGVPHLTQCPILPGGHTFRYEFDVPLGGTHLWHSHSGSQRGDGYYGNLIVRKAPEKEPYGPKGLKFYDFDLPEHEISIVDWMDELALPAFLNHHHSTGGNTPVGLLVNGKGIPGGFFDDFLPEETLQSKNKPFIPLPEFRVEQGKGYRFRLVSNGFLGCPVEVSIENHTLVMIASDGFDLTQAPVNSVVVYAGERWDFIVTATQPVGSYWIKFRGLMNTNVFQVAVLNYEGVPEGSLPQHSIKSWAEAGPAGNGVQLNPVNAAPGIPNESRTVAEISSIVDDDPQIIEQEKADVQYYIAFEFNQIRDISFFKDRHMPFMKTVQAGGKAYMPQINSFTNVFPVSPPLTQPDTIGSITSCDELSKTTNCTEEYCECTYIVAAKLNDIVELVLVDNGATFDSNHPFHLHGGAFRVVGMEQLNSTGTSPAIIQERDALGLVPRLRKLAPIKDTVTVPDGGYTILRFRADNPGLWAFHCHLDFHVEQGMAMVIQVGDLDQFPEIPRDFPKCGHYPPEN